MLDKVGSKDDMSGFLGNISYNNAKYFGTLKAYDRNLLYNVSIGLAEVAEVSSSSSRNQERSRMDKSWLSKDSSVDSSSGETSFKS